MENLIVLHFSKNNLKNNNMACLIENDLLNSDCAYSIGGLSKIYVANKEDVASYTQGSNGAITAITMESGKTFFTYDISKNTSNSNSTLTLGTGTKYILQSVDFFVTGDMIELTSAANVLGLGKFVIITEKRDGTKQIFGRLNGLEATVGEMPSGVAEGDSSALHFTFNSAELEFAPVFTGTVAL